MPVLAPSEYDVNYFDGYLNPTAAHPAGYTIYNQWNRISDEIVPIAQCTGEFFSDLMQYYNVLGFLDNKKVVELGCAKAYGVAWLRDNGIQAWGVDCSAYAISQARSDIQQYLTVSEALPYLTAQIKNAFNVLYTRFFLECVSDADLPALITQMNRVGFLQIHHINSQVNTAYYNLHPISWWLAQPFKNGTRFVVNNDVQNPYTV